MLGENAYSGHSIWITNIVEKFDSRIPLPKPIGALLTFGVVPFAFIGLFFSLNETTQNFSTIGIHLLAASVAAVGPALIWHYDENVFPNFIKQVEDVVNDKSALIEVVNRYERLFVNRYWLISIPWTLLIVVALTVNIGYFTSIGVTGVFDPAFLVYILFAIWWSILTGIGLHGAVITVLCIRAVGNLDLVVDPLHYDGLGGLSTIGYFSIRATLMNSIGSFTLPLAFAIATVGSYETIVYVAVAGYIGFILISFVYPTLYVNRRAQAVRERILEKKRQQIRELETQMSVDSTNGELAELETQLKIQKLRDDFHEYQSINLYPLSISILARLASSILLPIVFTILEAYVFTG
jgi:hypothetical protein